MYQVSVNLIIALLSIYRYITLLVHLLQGDFNLSNTQDGFLATAFLVGLLIASPVFSESCKHYSAFRLIGIGMSTWMLATFGCGLAVGFWSLVCCRMLVGVGEASFVALAAPFIGERGMAAAPALV